LSEFPSSWTAAVLPARPLILPRRRFVYPAQVDEVERGALELLVRPSGAEPFLATCALGFAGGLFGVWTCPDPDQLCAIAGGYAYILNTQHPERWEQVSYRPVLEVLAAVDHRLLLFAGHKAVQAYGLRGRVWETPSLSSEGLDGLRVEGDTLLGAGWDLMTDRALPFAVDLRTGKFPSVPFQNETV
jgi:hypothetical protein